MHCEKVNSITRIININNYTWDQLLRVSFFFFVNATFSSLSVSSLDMFVVFLFLFFFSFFLFPCLLLCILVHV